ncbi:MULTISPECIES: hypothetical protein [Nostocales]|uniref:Uncharacterized protein n=3 Tax=Nostocales TaxID=1161 RepID=A0A0C1R0S3_9CYAN|nr:hypothetical protein [Tolypothrix bouteillei]KAF3887267.1 hypothetical protein DA73_0400018570 [Tolypothrix bouteillei VB521301]
MQPNGWNNLLFPILLASSTTWCCLNKVDAVWAANPHYRDENQDLLLRISSLGIIRETDSNYYTREQLALQNKLQSLHKEIEKKLLTSEFLLSTAGNAELCDLHCSEGMSSNTQAQAGTNQPPETSTPQEQPQPAPVPETPSQEPSSPEINRQLTPPQLENPQLEGQPGNFTDPSSLPQIEQRLQSPDIERKQRIERLQELLKKNQESEGSFGELGTLLVRQQPLEQSPLPPQPKPVIQPKPVGFLFARVGYFQTNNIFSSAVDPKQDGLFYTGLSLSSAPLRLGSKTYLNASIDGNIIRYLDQSKYNYNQIRFNTSVYQQLSPRMYGELGWSNQQFFYARNGSFYNAGDRFLNENSVQLSFGRRDPLTPKLMLDTFYELRASFTNPPSNQDNRDRISNTVWLSLNYYWQKALQVGLNYQFSLSDFTRRERQDQYHRIYGHLTYGISTYTNLSLQGGFNLGSSTEQNIDFEGWFFTINYNLELGRF